MKEADKKALKDANGSWPENGSIEFKEVSMRYRDTMEPSLRGLTFTV